MGGWVVAEPEAPGSPRPIATGASGGDVAVPCDRTVVRGHGEHLGAGLRVTGAPQGHSKGFTAMLAMRGKVLGRSQGLGVTALTET